MIKVMMDYGDYPLWNINGENYNCIQETGIVYDQELKGKIKEYEVRWRLHANVLYDETFETDLTWDKVDNLGRWIAGRIKVLNPELQVLYFDETTEEYWEILPDNKGAFVYE